MATGAATGGPSTAVQMPTAVARANADRGKRIVISGSPLLPWSLAGERGRTISGSGRSGTRAGSGCGDVVPASRAPSRDTAKDVAAKPWRGGQSALVVSARGTARLQRGTPIVPESVTVTDLTGKRERNSQPVGSALRSAAISPRVGTVRRESRRSDRWSKTPKPPCPGSLRLNPGSRLPDGLPSDRI